MNVRNWAAGWFGIPVLAVAKLISRWRSAVPVSELVGPLLEF